MDLALAHQLSKRLSRMNRRNASPTDSRLKYEQLIAENLEEMQDKECIEILKEINNHKGKATINEPKPSELVLYSPDAVPKQEEEAAVSTSWWLSVCCAFQNRNQNKTFTPDVIVEFPESEDEEVVVEVTDGMRIKKELCVQTWIELISWNDPIESAEEVSQEPTEPAEPEIREERPLISRRGDIPIVVSNGNRPFSRGYHQYYRSSWRLKPSVIGAPETIGYDQD